jgi:phosphoribosyl 1,2-cyclic phosphate phosphodiesterase
VEAAPRRERAGAERVSGPHPTHFNVEEAVATANRIGASRTYLTHLTHRLRHGDLIERLPQHIRPAYDGLTVQI